jgi:hypothetical protein
VQGEKAGEKIFLWSQQLFFGQAIFIAATKSISLTSPEHLHKVNVLVTKGAANTHIEDFPPRRGSFRGLSRRAKQEDKHHRIVFDQRIFSSARRPEDKTFQVT